MIPAVVKDHRVKSKESEKRDKKLNLVRELRKLWNVKVTVIPTVIGTLGTILKHLVRGPEGSGIERLMETIQITALLRIQRRVLET